MIPAVDLLDEAEIARRGGEIALTKGENDRTRRQPTSVEVRASAAVDLATSNQVDHCHAHACSSWKSVSARIMNHGCMHGVGVVTTNVWKSPAADPPWPTSIFILGLLPRGPSRHLSAGGGCSAASSVSACASPPSEVLVP